MSACECAACGEHFTGLTASGRHQDVDYARRPAVVGRHPASLGMAQDRNRRRHQPADASSRERLRNLRAKRVSALVPVTPAVPRPAESRGGAP